MEWAQQHPAGRGVAVASAVPAAPGSWPSFRGPEAQPHQLLHRTLHERWELLSLELGEGLGGQGSVGASFLPSENSQWRIPGLRNPGSQTLGFLGQRNLSQSPCPPLPPHLGQWAL